MEYLHLWHKLRELFGKAGAIVGIVAIMVCLAFGEAIIKQIGDRIEPQWTELVGPVNLCAPSNASELKARQIDACRIQEGQTIAMMELSRGAEIRYDSPPKTYFSAFILQGSMFMKKAGGKLRIYALNREGLEMRVDNEFRVTENLSAGPDQLIGTGNPKFYRFERGQLDELKEMQNSLTFTGYTTFRRPDFERFSAQMGLSGIEFDHTLVQSHAEHRPDDVDKQVAQTFHHQAPATTTPFEKITSIRIVALSEEPVIVRLDSLERLSHSATSIDTTVLSGQVVVPRGVSYESVNIHIEPVHSKGIGREIAAVRVDSNYMFSSPGLPSGEWEVWAQARSETGELFTGNCAASTLAVDVASPWASRNPQTNLPRAKRAALQDCRNGILRLVPSPEKDKLRRSPANSKTHH